MDSVIEKVLHNLEKNNIKPFYLETKEEAVDLVAQLLSKGDTVTAGGSLSLFECGIIDYLRCGLYNFLDRYKAEISLQELRELYLKAMNADAYFCSSNAVTEAGELYNVDGNANRVSAIAYGPKSVIMVVGKNKIVGNIDDAVKRVKTVTAPQVCKRSGRNTYCKEKGVCVSITNGDLNMTSGCASPERSCCSFLVTGRQRVKDRIKVILINEDLGV